MNNLRGTVLFYSIIGVFLATATVTLLGLTKIVTIEGQYLAPLSSALVLQLVAAVIGLFRVTNWFGPNEDSWVGNRVVGNWWQLVRHGNDNLIAFVEIHYSEKERLLKLEGRAFTPTGAPHSMFWSTSAALNVATLDMHYFWVGTHRKASDDHSGVGYIRFTVSDNSENADGGTGWFTTGDVERALVTDRKKVEYRRASQEEAHAFSTFGEAENIQKLVASIYSGWV